MEKNSLMSLSEIKPKNSQNSIDPLLGQKVNGQKVNDQNVNDQKVNDLESGGSSETRQSLLRRSEVVSDVSKFFGPVNSRRKKSLASNPLAELTEKFHHSRNLRKPLPPIEAYQKTLQFQVDAPGRVIVRLERFMGSSKIRPNDSRYMKQLRGKLEADETVKWVQRRSARKSKEYDRYRKLVIDGRCDPPEGMEDLSHHPVFRANRMMDRLANMDVILNQEFHVKPPPIRAVEPFEEYAQTGFLFGSHPGHYLKVKDQSKSDFHEKVEEAELMFHSPQFDAEGKVLPPEKVPSLRKSILKRVGIDPPTRSPSPETVTIEPEHKLEEEPAREPTKAERVRADIEAAKKRYGINPDDIEKMWKAYDSPLIQMIDNTEADSIVEVSNNVVGAVQREGRFAEVFVNKTIQPLLSLSHTM